MINKVILVGRLGRDPEIRYTPSGKAVCNFSIATDEGFGEKKRTEWHNIVLWEKTAEVASKYLSKGSLVYIEGRLQTRSYLSAQAGEGKDGITRYRTEVIGQRMQMLSPKDSPGPVPSDMPAGDEDIFPACADRTPPAAGPAGSDDDIPF